MTNTVKRGTDTRDIQTSVSASIANIHGTRVAVEIRPHRQSTRYCPTTADAVAVASITHAVHRVAGDWMFRGSLAECKQWITDRQSAEQTRAIAGVAA